MFFTLQKIIALLITYKYAIIFPIAVIEGPTVSIIAGSLAQAGYLNVFLVYALIVFGDMVGDTIYYAIGRFGGLYFIRRWNHVFKIDTKKLIHIEKTFTDHGAKLLFIGKTQGLGSVVLMSAGLAKYPYGPFMWYNTLATLLKSFILLYIGYAFAKQYSVATDYIFKVGVVMSFVFLVGMYFYVRKQYKKL
jgi:membrane protein DedA with SNARE-associated domain